MVMPEPGTVEQRNLPGGWVGNNWVESERAEMLAALLQNLWDCRLIVRHARFSIMRKDFSILRNCELVNRAAEPGGAPCLHFLPDGMGDDLPVMVGQVIDIARDY